MAVGVYSVLLFLSLSFSMAAGKSLMQGQIAFIAKRLDSDLNEIQATDGSAALVAVVSRDQGFVTCRVDQSQAAVTSVINAPDVSYRVIGDKQIQDMWNRCQMVESRLKGTNHSSSIVTGSKSKPHNSPSHELPIETGSKLYNHYTSSMTGPDSKHLSPHESTRTGSKLDNQLPSTMKGHKSKLQSSHSLESFTKKGSKVQNIYTSSTMTGPEFNPLTSHDLFKQRGSKSKYGSSVLNPIPKPQPHDSSSQRGSKLHNLYALSKLMGSKSKSPMESFMVMDTSLEISPLSSLFSGPSHRLRPRSAGQQPPSGSNPMYANAPFKPDYTTGQPEGPGSHFAIVPGTHWCGKGNVATDYGDLGEHNQTDSCCRHHDHCPFYIPAFTTKYHYDNLKPWTLSYCSCDHALYTCLKKVDNINADTVGTMFFGMLGVQCFDFGQGDYCAHYHWTHLWCETRVSGPMAVVHDFPLRWSDDASGDALPVGK